MFNLIPRSVKNNLHLANAFLATAWYGFPASKLTVIGVTGTDGKTTTSTLIYHLLKSSGEKVALISTVGAYVGSREIDTGFHVTTPSPWLLQKLINKISSAGAKYLVLEATSHGLDQHRLYGTNIKIGVLTNITHEHIDYHKSYKNYVIAKAKLFENVNTAILNKKDESIKILKNLIDNSVKIIEYDTHTIDGKMRTAINKRFPENYNQLNATAALLAVKEFVSNENKLSSAFVTFPGIPGRMEEIKNNKGIVAIVDFAHTPNALKNVLETLKDKLKKGSKLIVVFGCAGERDVKKRTLMPAVSIPLADYSVFTAEDPRHEDLDEILAVMAESAVKSGGMEQTVEDYKNKSHKHVFFRVNDRKSAINFAVRKLAKSGDIVVICGKGHEKSMAFGSDELPWSDKEVLSSSLN